MPIMHYEPRINRRALIGGAAVALASTGISSAADAAHAQSTQKTFLLIHGAFLGGWCWRRVSDLLENAGHKVFSPALTGLGERSHLIGDRVSSIIWLDAFKPKDGDRVADLSALFGRFAQQAQDKGEAGFAPPSALEDWRRDYNNVRPHSRIGWLAPAVYAANLSPQSGQGAALAEGSAPWPVAPTVQDGNCQTLSATG